MLTGPRELIEKVRPWTLQGIDRDAYQRSHSEDSWYYEVVSPGFHSNMNDIQASLGIHQLEKLPAFQKRRREILNRYHKAFAEWPEIEIPSERPEVESAWHLYVIRLNLDRLAIDRNRFIQELEQHRIGTSVHFIPVHLQPYYRDKYGYKPEDFPVTYQNYLRIISLPLHPRLSDQDVEDVIEAVGDVVQKFRK